MGFLSDYIHYSSGNECPEEYLHWGGLSILGHVLGSKVWVKHGGYFRFFPNLYVCLVGDAGSGKNTCLGVNMRIMLKNFPSLLLSASIQSREDIAMLMSMPGCERIWTDREGKHGLPGLHYTYRPFYILNNELASFLSVDKTKMVEFLVEVFDGERFSTGFKGDRQKNPDAPQFIDNPHVSLIAGAVPTWFMNSLQMDMFQLGLGRRMMIIYSKRTKIVPDPQKPAGADECMVRVIDHLREANELYGEVIRDANAMKWWDRWYRDNRNKPTTDPILAQFKETEHMQVLKVALLLVMTERPFRFIMTADHLEAASILISNQREPIRQLTSGIGRNQLANVGVQVLDFIARVGEGVVDDRTLNKHFFRQMNTPEYKEVMDHYVRTESLILREDKATGKKFYFLPERFKEWERKKQAKNGDALPEGRGEAGENLGANHIPGK